MQHQHQKQSFLPCQVQVTSSFPARRWRSRRWTPHATFTSDKGRAPLGCSGRHQYDRSHALQLFPWTIWKGNLPLCFSNCRFWNWFWLKVHGNSNNTMIKDCKLPWGHTFSWVMHSMKSWIFYLSFCLLAYFEKVILQHFVEAYVEVGKGGAWEVNRLIWYMTIVHSEGLG